MHIKTKAILLLSQKHHENSILLKLFTREKGLVHCYIKNPRTKTRKTVKWQLLDLVNVDLIFTEKSDIYGLKESSYASNDVKRYAEPVRISIGYFMADVLLKSIGDRNIPHETLFDFAIDKINHLENDEKLGMFPLQFLIELSEALGIKPRIVQSGEVFNFSEGTIDQVARGLHSIGRPEVKILAELLKGTDLSPSPQERTVLLKLMLDFYRYHLLGFIELKSLEVLKEVLN